MSAPASVPVIEQAENGINWNMTARRDHHGKNKGVQGGKQGAALRRTGIRGALGGAFRADARGDGLLPGADAAEGRAVRLQRPQRRRI